MVDGMSWGMVDACVMRASFVCRFGSWPELVVARDVEGLVGQHLPGLPVPCEDPSLLELGGDLAAAVGQSRVDGASGAGHGRGEAAPAVDGEVAFRLVGLARHRRGDGPGDALAPPALGLRAPHLPLPFTSLGAFGLGESGEPVAFGELGVGSGLALGPVRLGRGSAFERAVGPFGVVHAHELGELPVQLVQACGLGLFAEPFLEGAVVAFDLSLGLR